MHSLPCRSVTEAHRNGGSTDGAPTNRYNSRSPLFNKLQFWDVVTSDTGIAFTLLVLPIGRITNDIPISALVDT